MKKRYNVFLIIILFPSCASKVGHLIKMPAKEKAQIHIEGTKQFRGLIFRLMEENKSDSVKVVKNEHNYNIYLLNEGSRHRAICTDVLLERKDSMISISKLFEYSKSKIIDVGCNNYLLDTINIRKSFNAIFDSTLTNYSYIKISENFKSKFITLYDRVDELEWEIIDSIPQNSIPIKSSKKK